MALLPSGFLGINVGPNKDTDDKEQDYFVCLSRLSPYAGYLTIINNSWGGGGFSNSEQSTINTCHNTYGAIVVAAAGNGLNSGGEQYASHYPSSYANVISVCAIGCSGAWGGWATYHPSVDLAAPGESIYSCLLYTSDAADE